MACSKMHKITWDAPNRSEVLPRILELSNTIFCADPKSKYASLAIWCERLGHLTSVILYLTVTGRDPEEPVAFLFALPRRHSPALQSGEMESLHIWLAGVNPEYRNGGFLAKLVEGLSDSSDRCLTVCTSPSVYPDMWNWLRKRWIVERALEGEKVLLSKTHETT